MRALVPMVVAATALASPAPALKPRLDDGLARTPQMGWNTYNQYNCFPNESIVHENAQALVDTGLADLGYRYVTIDCGWGVEDRLPNGTITWNPELFPQGFPAMGQYLHDLGLLFGVYGDSGILLCGSPPNITGSLYYEDIDARTFAEWGADSLKYDNCYSDAATNYPNVNYAPSTSPHPRFANMSRYIQAQDRDILFQVCEWGIDFPALWAPEIGHSWRIGNDIIPHWRSIFRTLNQAVPQTDFAGPGQWPDLDMLLVGLDGVLTVPEEQTHFSLWSILKSPLTIGAAIPGMRAESLEILSNADVIAFNQDALGVSAALRRRWSDEGYEVWSGPLEGGRTIAAVINWRDEDREITLDLPDIGLQYAETLQNVWADETVNGVKTSYSSVVEAHGVMLVQLAETVEEGVYPADVFAATNRDVTTFSDVYAITSSPNFVLNITLTEVTAAATNITIITDSSRRPISTSIPAGSSSISTSVSLIAGSNNTITIRNAPPLSSITLSPPEPTYYTGAQDFTLTSPAGAYTCPDAYCLPAGSKIVDLSTESAATAHINSSTSGSKYLEIDYINNEVAFDSSWGWGANSRNLTIKVNDNNPVRLEVPLSGRHSELFGPGLGWWDSGRLGVLTDGWIKGTNELVLSNEGGEGGFTKYAPDVVGIAVYD
uniref:Alpha-galactosidase D n=1 Tax=Emericella nidulans (strain FGSC A4 / ATCC 38163 / CBS 112.46 / NRRL 194 / M139) TaxID=227321 RepID=AGALD_EMENI|nr:RecName: Full=Alpha-galactosidase D; AltName: Full=Melibiase D; Flags: Precursor [Aspergillus nidulans FGSC A4]ABF50881.1 alpha-galactosidase [Aspergillus nidulans]